jgi:hypothetical protein
MQKTVKINSKYFIFTVTMDIGLKGMDLTSRLHKFEVKDAVTDEQLIDFSFSSDGYKEKTFKQALQKAEEDATEILTKAYPPSNTEDPNQKVLIELGYTKGKQQIYLANTND